MITLQKVLQKIVREIVQQLRSKNTFWEKLVQRGKKIFSLMPDGRTPSCKRLTWKFLTFVGKMIKERENRSYFLTASTLTRHRLSPPARSAVVVFSHHHFIDNRDHQKNVESSGSCTRRSFRGLPQGSSSRWSPSIQYAKQTNQPYSGVKISGALVNETNQTCYTT